MRGDNSKGVRNDDRGPRYRPVRDVVGGKEHTNRNRDARGPRRLRTATAAAVTTDNCEVMDSVTRVHRRSRRRDNSAVRRDNGASPRVVVSLSGFVSFSPVTVAETSSLGIDDNRLSAVRDVPFVRFCSFTTTDRAT